MPWHPKIKTSSHHLLIPFLMWNSKDMVGTMLQTGSQGHHSLSLLRLVICLPSFFVLHWSGTRGGYPCLSAPPSPETGTRHFNLVAGPHKKYKWTLNTCVLVPGLAQPKNESHMRFGMTLGSVNGEIIEFNCPYHRGHLFIVLTQ